MKGIIFNKNDEEYQPLIVQFPEEILLSEWELINSQVLLAELPRYKRGYEYKYKHKNNNKSASIQIRYESNTDGNVSRLISVYQNIKPATIRWQINSNNQGFYSIFNYNNKIHLTACLKNNGKTTVTEQQFYSDTFQHYLNPIRLFLWLMGIKPLTDNECYFILLTTDSSSDLTQYDSLNLVEIKNSWEEWINQFLNFL